MSERIHLSRLPASKSSIDVDSVSRYAQHEEICVRWFAIAAVELAAWSYASPRAAVSSRKDGAQEFGHFGNGKHVAVQPPRQIEGTKSEIRTEFRHVMPHDTGSLIEDSTRRSRQRMLACRHCRLPDGNRGLRSGRQT